MSNVFICRGALNMALNVLRRAGKTEVADELANSATDAEAVELRLASSEQRERVLREALDEALVWATYWTEYDGQMIERCHCCSFKDEEHSQDCLVTTFIKLSEDSEKALAATDHIPDVAVAIDSTDIATTLADQVVQTLYDSEPSDRTVDGQDLLSDTPWADMFVLDASDIKKVVSIAISNAIYDGVLSAGKVVDEDGGLNVSSHIEEVTKAILFEDCGSTQDWECNVELGKAAIRAYRPAVIACRNDAIEASAKIAERYSLIEAADEIRRLIDKARKGGE